MKKMYVLTTFIFCFGCFSSSAWAGNRAGVYSIAPTFARINFDSKQRLADASLPVLFVGYNFTDHVSVEQSFGYIDTTLSSSGATKVTGGLLITNLLYHFMLDAAVQPYVVSGVGLYQLKNPASTGANTQTALVGGAGAQFFVSHSIAFHGDIRDIYSVARGRHDPWVNIGMSFLFASP